MSARLTMCLVFTGMLLAACGTTREDRAISGGAIGAGAGGLAGAMTGNPVAGALIGGAGGAAAGAFTSPNQIDLGKPVWK